VHVALAQVERHEATISIGHAKLPGREIVMDRRNRLARHSLNFFQHVFVSLSAA
jgi:hypothetical protein